MGQRQRDAVLRRADRKLATLSREAASPRHRRRNTIRHIYEEPDDTFFVSSRQDAIRGVHLLIGTGDHVTQRNTFDPGGCAGHAATADRAAARQTRVRRRAPRRLLLHPDERPPQELPARARARCTIRHEANWRALIDGSDRRLSDGARLFSRTSWCWKSASTGSIRSACATTTATNTRLPFPEASYDAGLGTNAEYATNVLRLDYESMVTPQTVFDYDLATRDADHAQSAAGAVGIRRDLSTRPSV